ncbi:ArsR family transcriptional regulator / Methyltransferase [Salinisphaera shabanensis T35B1]|uniref:metalloregulator ArsR/SmtB family transcription factor n=1 Tax=Salinisphaera shabanensis TaxID=180542 RepID=UPI00333F95AF
MLDLADSTQLLRLLAEPTRLRLLLLLIDQPMTVAELTNVTQLTQSRVSSHLARLREAELVQDRAVANARFYSVDVKRWHHDMRPLWGALLDTLDDAVVHRDREHAAAIVRQRTARSSWVESVAGSMERQYSPGRTWEAMSRALIELLDLGDVIDIASGDGVLAELLCRRARHVTCVDRSAAVIDAARARLSHQTNVGFRIGDMHALPFDDASFDQAFLLHALSYSETPETALTEAARIVRPGGRLTLATIGRHEHASTVAAYDHVNLGFEVAQLTAWLETAGLHVHDCAERAREPQPPYFRVITASASKP